MFCGQCGRSLDPKDRFCAGCGAPTPAQRDITQDVISTTPLPPPLAAPPPPPVATRPSVAPPPPPIAATQVLPLPSAPPPPAPHAQVVLPPAPQRTGSSGLKIFGCLVAGFLGLILLIVIAYLSWPGPKPQDAVTHIRHAFAQHDVVEFNEYVDQDNVLGDAMDQIADAIAKGATSDQNQQSQAVAGIGGRIASNLLKPQVVPQMKQEVDEFVGSSTLAPSNNQNQSQQEQIFLQILHGVLDSQLTYQDSSVVSKSGDSATLGVRVKSPLKDEPVTLTLRMRLDQNHWRVVAISHLDELLDQIASHS
jgi:hypothetical protein